MDIEKAIDCLKADKEYLTDMKICDGEEMDIAIRALEKQIPKKILRGTVKRDMACYCPNCKEFVCFEDTEKHSYCPNCGQRLEW